MVQGSSEATGSLAPNWLFIHKVIAKAARLFFQRPFTYALWTGGPTTAALGLLAILGETAGDLTPNPERPQPASLATVAYHDPRAAAEGDGAEGIAEVFE